ncbi:MAG: HesB/IscA family protein [Candidatus Kariarchaeaceae archaeon]
MITNQTIKTPNEAFVTISKTAVNQIRKVIRQQHQNDFLLRLFIQASSGVLSFGMALDNKRNETDKSCFFDGIEVVIDQASFPYLNGASVDYIVSDHKEGFQITSPNSHLLADCGHDGCTSCAVAGCPAQAG